MERVVRLNVSKQTQQQIEQYIDEIEKHEFNTIYVDVESTDGVDPLVVSLFTQVMIAVDADPLNDESNLEFIPKYYLVGSSIPQVVIPSRIMKISTRAFENCKQLKTVLFEPQSRCTLIGEGAFAGSGIEEIIIPDSVENIYEEAFQLCSELKKVVLPATLESIEDGVFDYCPKLHDLIFQGTVQRWNELDINCFYNECDFIERIVCSDGVIDLERDF